MVAVVAGLLAAACGGSGGASGNSPSPGQSSSPGTSQTSVICRDLANIRASLDKLGKIQIGPGTGATVKQNAAEVKKNLDTLANDAGQKWQSQINNLKAAVSDLQTAAGKLVSQPSTDTVTAAAKAVQGVSAAAQTMLASISVDCPSAAALRADAALRRAR